MSRVSFNDMSSMASQRSNGGESAVLFYSNRCPHSQMILKTLESTNLAGSIRKISVDYPGVKIPSVVQSVPTLIARGFNRPIVGGEIGQWIQQQSKVMASMSSRPTQASVNPGVSATQMNGRTAPMAQQIPSSTSGALLMDTGGLGCYNDLDDCYSTIDGVEPPTRSNTKYTSLMDDMSVSVAGTAMPNGGGFGGERGYVDRKAQERKDESDRQLQRMKDERMQQMAGFHQKNPMVPSGYKAANIPPTFRNTIKNI